MIPVTVPFRVSGLGVSSRLVAFVLCALFGIALQVFVPFAFIPGTVLIALPLLLLRAKPWTNKPKDKGEEDWQPASMAEVDRLADAFRASRAIKVPFWYRPGSGLPLTFVLLFFMPASFFIDPRVGVALLDALLLLWPSLHFLRVKIWIPRDLELSLRSVQAALTIDLPPEVAVTPYLRLDRDAEGLRIPEDVRLMVEPRRKKTDLVGIQLQAAINSGPNGAVPYLYAVVLTRGKGPSWRAASAFRARGYEVESGGDDEYGTVVIRQSTSGGGYHTDEADCRHLMELVLSLLREL